MKQYPFFILVFLVGFLACKPTQPTQVTNYTEDLSVHRPVFTPVNREPEIQQVIIREPTELTGHIREELDSILSIIVAGNLEKKFWDGFTIQVYNGLNREQAYDVRTSLQTMELDLPIRLEYRQPNYKVKVGLYFDQFAAHADLITIKKQFSTALVIPEKIKLADYELSD